MGGGGVEQSRGVENEGDRILNGTVSADLTKKVAFQQGQVHVENKWISTGMLFQAERTPAQRCEGDHL